LRLDPFALPVRFAASDAAADERVRQVELHRDRVVVRRSLRGMRMAVNMPVSAFAGISLKLAPDHVAVTLEHRDPMLALPLYISEQTDDATAEWRAWGKVLGLPLLVEDDGRLREPYARIGGIRIDSPRPRRRSRSTLSKRRPSILMRRKLRRLGAAPVHRDEREIIARN
jgi:hypothetical protein